MTNLVTYDACRHIGTVARRLEVGLCSQPDLSTLTLLSNSQTLISHAVLGH